MREILSVHEDLKTAPEADNICFLAEKHSEQLFNFKTNESIKIDNISFHCISSDKNIIFKVRGNSNFFLKYSLKEEWVNREIIGARAVKATLAGFEGYKHANVIRASLKHKYTLYSSITGINFNNMLLKACLISTVKSPSFLTPTMYNLGQSIGRLHSYPPLENTQALNPTNLHHINTYISELKASNSIIDKIEQWVDKQPDNSGSIGWVHGNIKSEDIIISNRQVTLIDFGTCGSGEQHEDLTSLCAYMLLLRSVPLFPWRTAHQAMSTLLDAYAKDYTFDKQSLARHICYGIFRYYIKNVSMKNSMPTLSKMPVSKSRINHLVLKLLGDEFSEIFEGWGVKA